MAEESKTLRELERRICATRIVLPLEPVDGGLHMNKLVCHLRLSDCLVPRPTMSVPPDTVPKQRGIFSKCAREGR
jgi:hypothetical protein